jgi:hypothetical protein
MTTDQARQNWLATAEKLGHDMEQLAQTGEATSEVSLRGAGSAPLMAMSIENKTLGVDEVWDLGTSTTPQVININTLTMERGSSIVIRNTALTLTVQTLIRNS